MEFASFSLFFNFESGRAAKAKLTGLAAGASEVGPPRALEEAVAEAYEPRWRCCLCFWERFNDGNAALLLVSRLSVAEESEQESWPPNEEEEELPEDDDRVFILIQFNATIL